MRTITAPRDVVSGVMPRVLVIVARRLGIKHFQMPNRRRLSFRVLVYGSNVLPPAFGLATGAFDPSTRTIHVAGLGDVFTVLGHELAHAAEFILTGKNAGYGGRNEREYHSIHSEKLAHELEEVIGDVVAAHIGQHISRIVDELREFERLSGIL